MVDLIRAYSNRPDLCEELDQAVSQLGTARSESCAKRESVQSIQPPRIRLLSDRLTDDEVAKLLDYYQYGVTFTELAEQFAISTTSVKKILKVKKVQYRGHKFRR